MGGAALTILLAHCGYVSSYKAFGITPNGRWGDLPSSASGDDDEVKRGGSRIAGGSAVRRCARLPCPTNAIRIGFVGTGSSAGLGDSVAALVPPEATLEVLTIAEAARRIAAHELTVLIVAVDTRSWRQTVVDLRSIIDAGNAHPLAVFALVPRDDPAALVKAFELRVADVAGLPIDRHEVRARLAALVRRRRVAFAKAAETRTAWQLATHRPGDRPVQPPSSDDDPARRIRQRRAGSASRWR